MQFMNKTIKRFDPEKSSGFSLMELMVVIAIMGIMAAISLPRLMNPEHKASKAARELMGNMQKTRIFAIKNNQKYALVFVPGNNNYLICSDPGVDDSWSNTADNTTIKTISFTDYTAGIRYGNGTATTNATVDGGTFPAEFVSYNPPYYVLTFSPQGTCGAGYVYLFYGNASYAIGTLETGIVRIRRWTGGAWR